MKTALLLVAHGTPESVDQLPEFLRNIREGRPTSPAIVAEVKRRYQAIGGRSPLLDITRQQARLAADRLGIPWFVAMRRWHPYIRDVLREAASKEFERLLVVVMAPQSASVYAKAVQDAAGELREQGTRVPEIAIARYLGNESGVLDAYAQLLREELAQIDPRELARTVLIPSAHSLPLRALESGDPYPTLVEETAQGVLERLREQALPSILAYQSQGMTGDSWLGPDLPTVFDRAKATGASGVVVAPIGFLAEHVETLYDLDIEAREMAAERGLSFRRVPCPGVHSRMIEAIEEAARRLG